MSTRRTMSHICGTYTCIHTYKMHHIAIQLTSLYVIDNDTSSTMATHWKACMMLAHLFFESNEKEEQKQNVFVSEMNIIDSPY